MEYNNPSEIVKNLHFEKDATDKIVAGVEKLAKAVSSTLGASGNCVIYEDALGKIKEKLKEKEDGVKQQDTK